MLARFWFAEAALLTGALLLASPSMAGEFRHESGTGSEFVTRDGDRDVSWVIVRKQDAEKSSGRSGYSSSGSGEAEDFQDARRARARAGQDILWVRLDDRRYLIRDAALMEEIEEACLPQRLLGKQQSLLGRQQSRLGREQSQLGADQARLGARQARLHQRQAQIQTEIGRRARAGRGTAALERDLRELAREQSELGERQSELGRLQSSLGAEQGELGKRQSELGLQQRDLARETDAKVAALIREAIEKGLGEPIG